METPTATMQTKAIVWPKKNENKRLLSVMYPDGMEAVERLRAAGYVPQMSRLQFIARKSKEAKQDKKVFVEVMRSVEGDEQLRYECEQYLLATLG